LGEDVTIAGENYYGGL